MEQQNIDTELNEEIIEVSTPKTLIEARNSTWEQITSIPEYMGTRGLPWGHEMMNVEQAWKVSKGEGVVIGVLDSGVDYTHPDLNRSILQFYNVANGSYDNATDTDGHGTHVAGTIVANGKMQGIAPKAKIVSVKITNASGTTTAPIQTAGFDYLIDWRGPDGEKVDVINMSFTTQATESLRAAIERAVKAGIHVVISSGNTGDNWYNTMEYNWGTFLYGVSTAGRGHKNGHVVTKTNNNSQIDVITASDDVISCAPGGKYQVMSGSSMSAPHLAGAIALIKSAFRKNGIELSFKETEEIIKKCFIQPVPNNLAYRTNTYYGYGILDFAQNKLPKPNTLTPKKKGETLYPPLSASEGYTYHSMGFDKVWKHSTGEGKVIAFIGTGAISTKFTDNTIIGGRNFTAENDGDVTNYSSTVFDGAKAIGIAIGGKSKYNTSDFDNKYYEITGAAYGAKALVLKVVNDDLTFDPNNFTAAINYASSWIGPNGERVNAIVLQNTWDGNAVGFDRTSFSTAINNAGDNGAMVFAGSPSTVTTNLYPIQQSNRALINSGTLSISSSGYLYSTVSPAHTTTTANESSEYMCSVPSYGFPSINTATSTNNGSLASEYTGAVMAGAYVCLKGWYEQAGFEHGSNSSHAVIWNSELSKYVEPWEGIVKKRAGWGRLNLAYNELPEIITPAEMILNLANVVEVAGGGELEHYIENGIPKASTVRSSRRDDVVNKFK